jgi:UDP:flavonoid glycosyltransferase YjiC (YdhE family)
VRYLFTTLPTNDLGLLARALPVARELARAGHRVTFSHPAPAPRRVIADAGFANVDQHHPLFDMVAGGDPSLRGLARLLADRGWPRHGLSRRAFLARLVPALPWRSAPPTADVEGMDHAAAQMGLLNRGFVRASCAALADLIDRERPDAVVDFWNPFAVMAARWRGVPVVTVIQADAHPSSRGFTWWRPAAPAAYPSPVPAVNDVLAELGLPAVRTVRDLSVGERTLVVGTPETDPLPDGADVVYVGALLWEREGARLPEPVAALGRERPLAWLYAGNPRYGRRPGPLDSEVVLEAGLAALGGRDLDVVVTTGHHELPPGLGRLPPNVHHERFVPGLAMARHCDLMIHHGGYGSCQTALVGGTPSVILPTYSERESNARRMEAAGAAARVPVTGTARAKRVDPDHLGRVVDLVLATAAYRQRAGELRRRLDELGGAPHAAARIREVA